MKVKRYFAGWLALMSVLATSTVYVTGCLTPDQAAAIARGNAAVDNATALALSFEEEIKKVRGWIAEKKIDPAEGASILAKLTANRDRFIAVRDENMAAIKNMRAKETPWYGYLLYALNAAAGIAGTVLGVKKVGDVLGTIGAISRGFDMGLGAIPPEHAATVRTNLGSHLLARNEGTKAKALHHAAIAGSI